MGVGGSGGVRRVGVVGVGVGGWGVGGEGERESGGWVAAQPPVLAPLPS